MPDTCPHCGTIMLPMGGVEKCPKRGCGQPEKAPSKPRGAVSIPPPSERSSGHLPSKPSQTPQKTPKAPEKPADSVLAPPMTPAEARDVEESVIAKARITADLASDVTIQGLMATRHQLARGTHKDPAGAARNAATVLGIATDKLLALTGRPTQVIEHRDPKEIINALARELGVIEGRASDAA